MSIVSRALKTLDRARARLDDAGLRPFSVSVRVITWSGTCPGQGVPSVVETPVTVAGGRRPEITQVFDKDVIAGGVVTKARWKIANITPAYDGGGMDPATLDPANASEPNTQVFYVLKGPGMPASGMLCTKVADKLDRAFGYTIVIETMGREA